MPVEVVLVETVATKFPPPQVYVLLAISIAGLSFATQNREALGVGSLRLGFVAFVLTWIHATGWVIWVMLSFQSYKELLNLGTHFICLLLFGLFARNFLNVISGQGGATAIENMLDS